SSAVAVCASFCPAPGGCRSALAVPAACVGSDGPFFGPVWGVLLADLSAPLALAPGPDAVFSSLPPALVAAFGPGCGSVLAGPWLLACGGAPPFVWPALACWSFRSRPLPSPAWPFGAVRVSLLAVCGLPPVAWWSSLACARSAAVVPSVPPSFFWACGGWPAFGLPPLAWPASAFAPLSPWSFAWPDAPLGG